MLPDEDKRYIDRILPSTDDMLLMDDWEFNVCLWKTSIGWIVVMVLLMKMVVELLLRVRL